MSACAHWQTLRARLRVLRAVQTHISFGPQGASSGLSADLRETAWGADFSDIITHNSVQFEHVFPAAELVMNV